MAINEINTKAGNFFTSADDRSSTLPNRGYTTDHDDNWPRIQQALLELFKATKNMDLFPDADRLKDLASHLDRSPRQVEIILAALKSFQQAGDADHATLTTSVAEEVEQPPLDNLLNGDPTML